MAKQSGNGPGAAETKTAKESETHPGNGEEALAAIVKVNEAMLEGVAAMQREIAEFGSTRLREDLETQGALAQCKDLQEALRLQVEYTQKALQQYSEETAKLVDLSARISRDCWAPFEAVTRGALRQKTPR